MDLRFDFLSVFALNRRYATERSSRHRRAGRGHARGICRYRRRLSPRLRPSMVSARQAPAATPAHELGVAPGRVALWHAPSNVRSATGQHLALVQRR